MNRALESPNTRQRWLWERVLRDKNRVLRELREKLAVSTEKVNKAEDEVNALREGSTHASERIAVVEQDAALRVATANEAAAAARRILADAETRAAQAQERAAKAEARAAKAEARAVQAEAEAAQARLEEEKAQIQILKSQTEDNLWLERREAEQARAAQAEAQREEMEKRAAASHARATAAEHALAEQAGLRREAEGLAEERLARLERLDRQLKEGLEKEAAARNDARASARVEELEEQFMVLQARAVEVDEALADQMRLRGEAEAKFEQQNQVLTAMEKELRTFRAERVLLAPGDAARALLAHERDDVGLRDENNRLHMLLTIARQDNKESLVKPSRPVQIPIRAMEE